MIRRRGKPAPPPPPLPTLPFEVVVRILKYLFQSDQSATGKLLSLNSGVQRALFPVVYARVELHTSTALARFAELVRERPEAARAVRSLWIGPSHARSDLLSILSAPLPGDSAYLESLREEVYTHTRFVLRACRRLKDVALSGSLVSAAVVHSYGTACQPVRLTSINPHSFVSGFDAPIFRKVQDLTVCDINLSFSEADAIRRLPALKCFEYTSPKDYGDVVRDITVLRKLLALDDASLEDSLARLLLDARPSWLQRLHFRAVPQRAKKVVAALKEALETAPRGVDIAQAELAHEFVNEWDALRDLVFNAQGDYSRQVLGDDVGSWVDPSHALEQLRAEWRQRSVEVLA